MEPEKTLLSFTVDRSRWLRGEGSNKSFLLRPDDGKMCCLGFACLAAGHKADEIRGVDAPAALRDSTNRVLLPNWNTVHVMRAMETNDLTFLSEAERERLISTMLAEVGIAVTFVDGPLPPHPAECPNRGFGHHVRAPLDDQCIHCQAALHERDGMWERTE